MEQGQQQGGSSLGDLPSTNTEGIRPAAVRGDMAGGEVGVDAGARKLHPPDPGWNSGESVPGVWVNTNPSASLMEGTMVAPVSRSALTVWG